MHDLLRPPTSNLQLPTSNIRSAFTLVEMLTTVAALIILMGLAVSLAREVRRRSADVLTRDLLTQLDGMLKEYIARNKIVPAVKAISVPPDGEDPSNALQATARQNNEQTVRTLHEVGGFADELFGKLPRSMYDDETLRDAWGSPIVFMATMHPQIGMAADNKPFFFSAGPDRNYLTRVDNLYSYEVR